MAFGFLGKMASGMGKGISKAGKAMTGQGGGGGINAGPSQGFMSRFKQAAPTALNNAAQAFGGNMAPMARMTGQMNMRRPQEPGGVTGMPAPTPDGINTGPSNNFMPQMGGSGFANPGMYGGWWNPNRPRLDPNTNEYTTPQNPMGDMGSIFSRIYGNMGSQVPNRPQIYY